jgi:hypothetical protein
MDQIREFAHGGPFSMHACATLNDSTPSSQAEILQGFPSPRVIHFPRIRPRAAVRSHFI